MSGTHLGNATTWIRASLIAAINVRPRDPGLTEDELRSLVVGREGIGEGAFRDAVRQLDHYPRDSKRRLVARSTDLSELMINAAPIPDEVRPRAALNALGTAFEALANEEGEGDAADRGLLHARCTAVPPEDVDRALALLAAQDTLKETPTGFVRRRSWPHYDRAQERDDFLGRIAGPAKTLLGAVRDTFARRAGEHAPSDPPSDRFGRFLSKQGWTGFVSWWTQTLREMRSMVDTREPTSICVLCGSLLEAALVAIAKPAKDATEWRQKFLQNAPDKWKLGELIDQAKEASVFTNDQFAHAQTLMNARNRIHAGKFAAGDTFNPPYTNAHEARLARDHLELLLGAILDWHVIRALT